MAFQSAAAFRRDFDSIGLNFVDCAAGEARHFAGVRRHREQTLAHLQFRGAAIESVQAVCIEDDGNFGMGLDHGADEGLRFVLRRESWADP